MTRRHADGARLQAPTKLAAGIALLLIGFFLSGCSYPVMMRSREGENLRGRYRVDAEGGGLIQVTTVEGEVLLGSLAQVNRTAFVDGYEQAFGRGSIEWDGPDLSGAGNVFLGLLGVSYVLAESATGERFNAPPGKSTTVISGPLFFWTALLEGDQRGSMRCYLIGSNYTGGGFGRCMGDKGTEYSVEF